MESKLTMCLAERKKIGVNIDKWRIKRREREGRNGKKEKKKNKNKEKNKRKERRVPDQGSKGSEKGKEEILD